jgi:hypothetical protein
VVNRKAGTGGDDSIPADDAPYDPQILHAPAARNSPFGPNPMSPRTNADAIGDLQAVVETFTTPRSEEKIPVPASP